MITNNSTVRASKDKSFLEINLNQINALIDKNNQFELDKFVKEIHNADLAEIIQNLDNEIRLKFIIKIKSFFDPEILTYLNESIREAVGI